MAVHEIRVHGVHNTPPEGMLAVGEDQKVVRFAGDDHSGFWRATPPKLPTYIETREAYSWGNLTSAQRTGGKLSAVARAGWLLLLPFAMVNVGYWTRALRLPDEPKETGRYGAALFRVAGLLLTALYVVTATQIGAGLVAWQCYGTKDTCSGLPALLDFLYGAPPGRRVAAGLVVPIALVTMLWALSRKSLQLYEDHGGQDVETGDKHVLERTRMWWGRRRVLRLQRLHIAFGLGCAVAASAWPMTAPGAARHAAPAVTLVAALALLLAVVVVCVVQTSDGAEYDGPPECSKGVPDVLLGFAVVLTLAHLVVIAVPRYKVDAGGDMPGSGAIPLVIALALVGCVVLAYALRDRRGLVLCATAFVTAVAQPSSEDTARRRATLYLVVGAVLVGALWLRHRDVRNDADNKWRGWGGAAPALLLGAGVLFALLFTSAASLLVADRLNGDPGANALRTTTLGPDPTRPVTPVPAKCEPSTYTDTEVSVTCTAAKGEARPLAVPLLHFYLAPALAACILSWLLITLVVYVRVRRRHRKAVNEEVEDEYPLVRDSTNLGGEAEQRRRVKQARLQARFSHRAERLVGMLAPMSALLVLSGVLAALARLPPDAASLPKPLLDSGLYVVGGAATALLALGALVYRNGDARSSLAIAWDLSCFWPRAAHPFGPPCYAERAVPDLTIRVRWRLATTGDRVILSGHSLGSTLAVATFFRIPNDERKRVALLTYGSQLRAYFGRLFPEVLGSDVLGNGRTGQTPLFGEPDAEPPAPGALTMAGQLGLGVVGAKQRWRSLFRPADYLGFRVYHAAPDATVDDKTLETGIPWTVGEPLPPPVETHSDYPRTKEYEQALEDLAT